MVSYNNNNNNNNNYKLETKDFVIYSSVLFTAGLSAFVVARYKTSRSHEWLVRTGLGIKNIQINKKFIHWPFQNIDIIKMTPKSYRFSVNAMSKEKMEFNFPAIFTIGPINNNDALIRYSTFLLNQKEDDKNTIIRGIIEGETRTLSANLSIEDIFTGRSEFKNDVVVNIKGQLEQYGLDIYNANIEELRDSETSNYFKSLSQRIKSQAENRAKVEVSEQNKIGDVGSKEREGETRQSVINIESITTLVENQKKQEIIKSNAELEKLNAEQNLIILQAKLRSENESKFLQMELETLVEIKRRDMELEKKRATELSESIVDAEIKAKRAEGEYISVKISTDAQLYQQQKMAEGFLFAKEREAEGIRKIYEAEAEGLKKIIDSFNGNSQTFIMNKMIENGIFEKLAKENASAIQGLNPKINVWTHDPNQSMDTIQNLGKSIIPMVEMSKQYGIELPDWLLKKDINTSYHSK